MNLFSVFSAEGKPQAEEWQLEQQHNQVDWGQQGVIRPVATLTTEFQTASGSNARTRTVRLELHEMGFHGRAAAHKPKMTMRNAKRWLEWCKAYRHWTLEQWKCHDNAPVHKAGSIQKWFVEIGVEELDGLHRALTSTPSNTFGINWNADYEPGLITQHQCPTSLMLLSSQWLLHNQGQPLIKGLSVLEMRPSLPQDRGNFVPAVHSPVGLLEERSRETGRGSGPKAAGIEMRSANRISQPSHALLLSALVTSSGLGTMTSLKRPPMERIVGGSIPAIDEFYTRHLRLANGGAPPARTDSAHPPGGPGVPKMGVRARVAEWPPRKDLGALWQVTTEPESPGLAGGGQSHLKLGHLMSPQDSSMLRNIHNTLKSKTQGASYSPDSRYLSPTDYRVPSHRNTRRIRQRSNSDITISELDGGGDSGEDWGPSGAKWSPLHREYGSTSSIDQHGASGESFFEMLKGYHGDKPDQRSPAPDRLEDLLTAGLKQASIELHEETSESQASNRVKEREKPTKRRSKSETGGESIFRKLRSVRGESPRAGSDAEDGRSEDWVTPLKPWVCQRGFSHYDVQSMMFDLNDVIQSRQTASGKRKNTTTGASAAAAASNTSTLSSTQSLAYSSPAGSQEELSAGARDSPSMDTGDEQSNEMLLSCPCFRNEIGANGRRTAGAGPPKQGSGGSGTLGSEGNLFESSLSSHCTNAGVAVLEGPKDSPSALSDRGKHYIVEHVDLGAYYYRKFFYLREHWNYFGMDEALGPVAVSVRREKQEEQKEHGQQYNYRVIFRTSELTTLRGSILEDAVPSSSKHGTTRGLPLKEVLEHLLPELDVPCLRLALNTPKVTEQLMKLDEQGLSFQVKVGVMYCRAGQSSEEEMYNNEKAGPALEEFLQLLGERVRLQGFTKYRAQLDTKTDSTGTHSLYTAYRDYEIMFHVSTLLPYTPNNKQQLLRKRHIGNDIVTIVFQEPGALPFTPKTIRSHFQHVFIIVRVHSPCSDNTCYSTNSKKFWDTIHLYADDTIFCCLADGMGPYSTVLPCSQTLPEEHLRDPRCDADDLCEKEGRGCDSFPGRALLRPSYPQGCDLPQVHCLQGLPAGQGHQRRERCPQV
ncbi:hypothetical protein J4Q44_G00249740 [Coregonus suidteri]|uniref:Rap-GAP domain-containing protein n=1 Tax=Coregonus suidteri TaxID=861788 RepID=A0AAN8L826_9TELE